MNEARAVLLSLLPAAFWLGYVVASAPRPASRWLLGTAFLAGALSPLAVIGLSIVCDLGDVPATPAGQLVFFILAVGLVEEFSKLLAVRLTVYYHASFREPWDGLMYSCAAALGFASSENVKYVLGFEDAGILVSRSLLSTPGHVLMSAFWGYALGRQRRSETLGKTRGLLTLEGLAYASLAHGLYDWLLVQGYSLPAVGLLCALGAVFRLRVAESALTSRRGGARKVVECPACRTLVRAACRYCTGCGQELGSLPVHCGNCLKPADGETCASCGCLLAG